MSGELIAGRYQLIQRLGAGGMGAVWRGYDTVLDREVAVKLIRRDLLAVDDDVDEFVHRFRREARVTARLDHPGVPAIYDADLDASADRLYLVMQLIRGVPVRELLDRVGPLPVEWAASIAAQICAVLAEAHAVPAVHRDLNPRNVMVATDGTVKVLDFGVAAILRSDVTRLTHTGHSPIGTFHYMSPEQIQTHTVSPHSDLYALGCMLFEFLAGRPVFDTVETFTLLGQHVNEPPPELRALRPDVPEALAGLVADLLAKQPEHRPASAQDVHERLVPFLPLAAPARSRGAEAEDTHDPTGPFRRPLAPRRATAPTPPAPETPIPEAPVASGRGGVPLGPEVIDLHAQAVALLEEDRVAQAVELLEEAITRARSVAGPDDVRVLRLRATRALALFLGGDHRRAVPELEDLAARFTQVVGPNSNEALDCANQAAIGRAVLGEFTVALADFETLLERLRRAVGDGDLRALKARRYIAELLANSGRKAEAITVARELLGDLQVLLGPDHPLTREITELLRRLQND